MGFWDWLVSTPEPTPEPTPVAGPPTRAQIEAALDKAEQMAVSGAAPAPVLSRVRRIATLVREMLPRLDSEGLASQNTYNVTATATDYLPESLAAYLALPRDWADTRPVADGKSSLMLLIDQLDLLAATLNKMFDAANRHDAAALIAHGMFLQERFGGGAAPTRLDETPTVSNNPLDLGTS